MQLSSKIINVRPCYCKIRSFMVMLHSHLVRFDLQGATAVSTDRPSAADASNPIKKRNGKPCIVSCKVSTVRGTRSERQQWCCLLTLLCSLWPAYLPALSRPCCHLPLKCLLTFTMSVTKVMALGWGIQSVREVQDTDCMLHLAHQYAVAYSSNYTSTVATANPLLQPTCGCSALNMLQLTHLAAAHSPCSLTSLQLTPHAHVPYAGSLTTLKHSYGCSSHLTTAHLPCCSSHTMLLVNMGSRLHPLQMPT